MMCANAFLINPSVLIDLIRKHLHADDASLFTPFSILILH